MYKGISDRNRSQLNRKPQQLSGGRSRSGVEPGGYWRVGDPDPHSLRPGPLLGRLGVDLGQVVLEDGRVLGDLPARPADPHRGVTRAGIPDGDPPVAPAVGLGGDGPVLGAPADVQRAGGLGLAVQPPDHLHRLERQPGQVDVVGRRRAGRRGPGRARPAAAAAPRRRHTPGAPGRAAPGAARRSRPSRPRGSGTPGWDGARPSAEPPSRRAAGCSPPPGRAASCRIRRTGPARRWRGRRPAGPSRSAGRRIRRRSRRARGRSHQARRVHSSSFRFHQSREAVWTAHGLSMQWGVRLGMAAAYLDSAPCRSRRLAERPAGRAWIARSASLGSR